MPTLTTQTLETAEFNELRDYLAKQKEQQQGLNIEEAHGYITGLICGPEIVHPSLWISDIFNGPAEFDSAEHETRIISYLCRLYNDTARTVQKGEDFPEHYYPAHPSRTATEINFQAIKDWCDGLALALTDDNWLEIDEYRQLTLPIMLSCASDEDTTLKDFCAEREASAEDIRRYFLPFIMPAVHQLYAYLAEIKHHADISMLDDDQGPEHQCHEGCGTVH